MKSLKLKSLVVSLAAVLAAPAFAAIAGGTTGNGELFLNVVELDNASYTFDTGLRMNDFFVSGQMASTNLSFNIAADPLYQTFLSKVSNAANLQWSVVAFDSTGPNTPNSQRLFTTANVNDEAMVSTMTNQNLSLALSQGNRFFDSINAVSFGASGQSTHTTTSQTEFTRNGSSYSLKSDAVGVNAFYGRSGALTPNYNTQAPFVATNAVGAASSFFYLTRSGTGGVDTVMVDPFNSGNTPISFNFDGQSLMAAPVPEPESYALLLSGLAALALLARRRRNA